MNTINYEKMLDKIHGCWYGKCLGGAAGAPVEGIKKIIDVDNFEEIYNPDLPNDDLDIQLLWLDVLERKGINITSCDLADAWLEKCWYPFSEYGYFMKNYERGLKPPYSGILNNDFFKEGMGCPIRSEIWGLISAGNAKLAADYAYTDAVLDHADNSVYAEQFLAAAEALAFFETDIADVVKKALKFVPDSKLKDCICDVIDCFEDGKDWLSARKMITAHYSHPDFTNVVQNLGFTVIGLLYGEMDMRRTVNIALKCGYDTDCTCASAAALLGIVLGYENMGDVNKLINDYFICGIDVVRPSDSIRGLAEDTIKIALAIDNDCLQITDVPQKYADIKKTKPDLKLAVFNEEEFEDELAKLDFVPWRVYGPYFDQLDKAPDPRYPSPHGEGSVLPDLVCMVNNNVEFDRQYIDESTLKMPKEDFVMEIPAYEDYIPIQECLGAEGQMCVYLETTLVSPKAQKVWILAGNSDAFKVWVNDSEVLSADETRYWTPYNNFCLADLNEGENRIVLKLLRRTDDIKFSIGFRKYDGNHWHRSKWHTDLKFI